MEVYMARASGGRKISAIKAVSHKSRLASEWHLASGTSERPS